MRTPVRIVSTLSFGLCFAVAAVGFAQRGAKPATTASDTTARIVAAAQAVVATLDEAGKAKVQFPFEGPQKTRWSNLPVGIFQREGLLLKDLTPPQRAAVNTLLATALSKDGLRKVTEIMGGDEALRIGQSGRGGGDGRGRGGARGGGGGGVQFGGDLYFLAFVGTPSVTDAVDAAVRRPPSGDQPDDGGEPVEHGAEPARHSAGDLHARRPDHPSARQRERQGLRADQRPDDAQRKQAVLGYTVSDLVLGPLPGWKDDSARGHSRVGSRRPAADDAPGARARMGGHHERHVRRARRWPRSGRTFPIPTSPGAARRRTAARRTSVSRVQPW